MINSYFKTLIFAPLVSLLVLALFIVVDNINLGVSYIVSSSQLFFSFLYALMGCFTFNLLLVTSFSLIYKAIFKKDIKFNSLFFILVFILFFAVFHFVIGDISYWFELISKKFIINILVVALILLIINQILYSFAFREVALNFLIIFRVMFSIVSVLVLMLVFNNSRISNLEKARDLEFSGQIKAAIEIYQENLNEIEIADVRAKIKFHLGMLYYRQGEYDNARQQWQELVLEFSNQSKLIKRAAYFEEQLSKIDDKTLTDREPLKRSSDNHIKTNNRIILPGVKLNALYKSAYCMPNTMAQMFRVWYSLESKKDSTFIKMSEKEKEQLLYEMNAKNIGKYFTIDDQGTPIAMAVFLAEKNGFEMILKDRSSINDLKKLIDNEFSVMVFFQGHVVMVYGYDDVLNSLILYDTDSWELIADVPIDEFEKKWNADLSMLGVMTTVERKSDLSAILGKDMDKQSDGILFYMMNDDVEPIYNLKSKFLKKASDLGNPEAVRESFVRLNYLGDTASYYRNDSLYFKKGVRHYRLVNHIEYIEKNFGADSVIVFIDNLRKHQRLSWDIVDRFIAILDSSGHKDYAEEIAWSEMDEDGVLGEGSLFFLANYAYEKEDYITAKDLLERILLKDQVAIKYKSKAMKIWMDIVDSTEVSNSIQNVYYNYLNERKCLDIMVVENFMELDTSFFDEITKNLHYKMKGCIVK